ncbi:MAG: NAD(P)/FAD-dependent oxidoreductase [Gemmatimonadota bacterium]
MSREFEYLIVGGGLAAASAVDGVRAGDAEGSVLMLAEESEPPYHRPPLSKEYVQASEAPRELLHIKPRGWFEREAGITLRLGERAVGLQPRELTVTTSGGAAYRGGHVLLATGGRPRALEIPGSELQGLFTLRTVEDAERIRAAALGAEQAVLVGSGFIGMELASSLTKLGVSCTVVEAADRVWPGLLPPELSKFMQEYFEARGVRFRLGSRPRELHGSGGRLIAALLDDGVELPCQLAVAGLGIVPRTELAAEAGLEVDDGIVVNGCGETSHDHIYAAGDAARFPDPLSGHLTRVEHWDHARAHGKCVGRNMAGDRQPYDHLSYFFTHVFDLGISVFGRPAEADRVILRGAPEAGRSLALCGVQGRLCGAILINANDELRRCQELVRQRPPLSEVEREL